MPRYGSVTEVFNTMQALIDAHQPVHAHCTNEEDPDLRDLYVLPVQEDSGEFYVVLLKDTGKAWLKAGKLFFFEFEDFQYMTFEPYTPDNDDWKQYL